MLNFERETSKHIYIMNHNEKRCVVVVSPLWTVMDEPLNEVIGLHAEDDEALLGVRAWEVKESPNDLGYEVVNDWPKIPSSWKLGPVAGVAIDSKERYYVLHRGKKAPPLICFDRAGEVLRSWGEGEYKRPHMVKCDEDDNMWLIDDLGHILYLYSPEGKILRTLGTEGISGRDKTHFNQPTDIAFGLNGEFYVTDGYGIGNKRVVRFDRNLNYLEEWGSEGEGKGQFILPHGITTDRNGWVYVADRNKWRVQIFNADGTYQCQWTHIGRPSNIVCTQDGYFFTCDAKNGRVTKIDEAGKIIGFFGIPGHDVGQLSSAHDIAVAKNGDILVAQLDGRAQLFRHSNAKEHDE